MTSKRVTLASTSLIRAQLLRNAGVEFAQVAPAVDEEKVKRRMLSTTRDAGDLAQKLAAEKALSISKTHHDDLVIGCDQVLECDGHIHNKPNSVDSARTTLLALRGREHILHTAVVLAQQGGIIWQHLDVPRLCMRSFSDEFLDHFIDCSGEQVTWSAGAYQLENHGVQLFSAIDGDYFAILGLPLLPLLAVLRLHAGLES